MSAEEAYVSVVSEDEEIDVGTEEAGEIADCFDDDGGEGPRKGQHHNELEKMRRKTLNATYDSLTTVVKHIFPKHKNTKMGRDKTLEMGLSVLKAQVKEFNSNKEKARQMAAAHRAELARDRTMSEEKRKELTEKAERLEEIAKVEMLRNQNAMKEVFGTLSSANSDNNDTNDNSDESDGWSDDSDDDDDVNFTENNENVTPHHSP